MSLSLTLRPTVSRPIYVGIKHPSGAYEEIFNYCQTVGDLLMWVSLSHERTDMSFTIAAGLRQRSHSRVRVLWDSLPYFTLIFSSPPTTRRATVEVFDLASNAMRSYLNGRLCSLEVSIRVSMENICCFRRNDLFSKSLHLSFSYPRKCLPTRSLAMDLHVILQDPKVKQRTSALRYSNKGLSYGTGTKDHLCVRQ
jgi:hypothetical protein